MTDWLDRFAQEIGGDVGELSELIAQNPAAAVPAPSKPAPVLFNARGVPVNQPRPTFNADTDGNPFAWILKATHAVRIQEKAANEVRRIRLQSARRCAMPVLVAPTERTTP